MALPAQDIVLAEENNVRLAENAVTTTAFFLFFWASFGVSWLVSKRIVPQFKSFSAVEKADWCSRVNSTIHAVFVIIGVGLALAHIQWGEDHLPVSSLRMASFVFSFAIGYFLCDLMIILIWPVPMQSVFVIHHVVAVIPYFINNFIACCAACQYGLLLFLLVELATLPLNVRGFIESIGSDPSKNHTRAIYATYFIWAISRTLLPIYLIYVFWTDAFPSDRNQDVCLYPSMHVGVGGSPVQQQLDRKSASTMRLTVDVILRAHVCINPLREREINLRGYRAPAIENLGATKASAAATARYCCCCCRDGFDCIDLSDNEIKKLENFPRLKRLRMLLLNNNHIAKFQDNLAESISNLEYLILTGNSVASLEEVDRLVCFTKLDIRFLVALCALAVLIALLYRTELTKRKYYREYVINKLPQLRVLDYQKIKPKEREAAAIFFNSGIGKQYEQEVHGNEAPQTNHAVPAVAAAVAPPPAPQMTVQAPPPPPPPAAVQARAVSPKKEAKNAPAPAPAAPATPVKAAVKDVKMKTPVKAKVKDIEMEDASDVPPAKYTPSKPIQQMTVNDLREELKQRGLPTKGLKAALVKRLREAVEGA
ncbi:TPA: hypothetical protein N0F65_001586 [Lagenidium giganteum]|uniref:SAP domain-containing protein n=1 Tax=Lagenidium giganteum TaxID=4803 RepID=A0AAV2Z7D6_9STRA|nr:TPA: hypothetical protein N0F65_001586 [Lagenidium giganteum]